MVMVTAQVMVATLADPVLLHWLTGVAALARFAPTVTASPTVAARPRAMRTTLPGERATRAAMAKLSFLRERCAQGGPPEHDILRKAYILIFPT